VKKQVQFRNILSEQHRRRNLIVVLDVHNRSILWLKAVNVFFDYADVGARRLFILEKIMICIKLHKLGSSISNPIFDTGCNVNFGEFL